MLAVVYDRICGLKLIGYFGVLIVTGTFYFQNVQVTIRTQYSFHPITFISIDMCKRSSIITLYLE